MDLKETFMNMMIFHQIYFDLNLIFISLFNYFNLWHFTCTNTYSYYFIYFIIYGKYVGSIPKIVNINLYPINHPKDEIQDLDNYNMKIRNIYVNLKISCLNVKIYYLIYILNDVKDQSTYHA